MRKSSTASKSALGDLGRSRVRQLSRSRSQRKCTVGFCSTRVIVNCSAAAVSQDCRSLKVPSRCRVTVPIVVAVIRSKTLHGTRHSTTVQHPSGHSRSKDDCIRHAHSYFEDSSNRFKEASHQGRDRDRPRPEPTPHWRNRPQLIRYSPEVRAGVGHCSAIKTNSGPPLSHSALSCCRGCRRRKGVSPCAQISDSDMFRT